MTANAKTRAALFQDPARPSLALEKISLVLQKICELEIYEAANFASFSAGLASVEGECVVFVDARLLAGAESIPPAKLKSKRITLVVGDAEDGKADVDWRAYFPSVDVGGAANADLPRLLQLAISPESSPGIFALADRGSEIFYEKIKGLADIGTKIDRLVEAVEKKNPELVVPAFNLRQLSYAILHHAFSYAPKNAGVATFLDFQASVNEGRIVFATAFNAPPETIRSIVGGMLNGGDPIWRTAWLCADALVLTEVSSSAMVEVKALLAGDARYSATSGKTLLYRTVEAFAPDENSLSLQKGAKLIPLSASAAQAGGEAATRAENAPAAAQNSDAGGAAGNPLGTQLNFKLKAELLEGERTTLQGLVKKKNHLITELNKDVNRAQREAMQAKNSALKELRDMRMEVEKAERAAHLATEKLERLERKVAEEKATREVASGAGAIAAPVRDFEKELKQAEYAKRLAEEKVSELNSRATLHDENLQKLRRELDASRGEVNELKAKLLKLEKSLEVKSKESSGEAKDAATQENLAEKVKELQKQLGESRTREQELDRDSKRLSIRLESAEQTVKGTQAATEKRLEASDKQMEEAKRKVTDISKKLEDERAETRAQVEEWKQKERELKKQNEDLAEQLREKTAELEAALKSTEEARKAS